MRRRGPTPGTRPRGVTLIELVVVLTIIAVVGSIASTLVARVAAGQQATRERLGLAQRADAAMARIGDELQAALPNSVRLSSGAGGVWIEMVPVLDGGRYRAAGDSIAASPGDILDLNDASDTSFDVIGQPLSTLAAGSQLVIQNLGTPEADAYAGSNRRAGLVRAAAGRNLQFTPAGALPSSTDTRRFFIVGSPVSFACVGAAGGGFDLMRYSGYGWQATQPASSGNAALATATRTLLLGGLSDCAAAYSQALANIGLLNLRLRLGEPGSGVKMDFLQQLALDNTP